MYVSAFYVNLMEEYFIPVKNCKEILQIWLAFYYLNKLMEVFYYFCQTIDFFCELVDDMDQVIRVLKIVHCFNSCAYIVMKLMEDCTNNFYFDVLIKLIDAFNVIVNPIV